MARDSAEDGVREHSLTRIGLRALQMDLEALAVLVGEAIPGTDGVEPDDEFIRGQRQRRLDRDAAFRGEGATGA